MDDLASIVTSIDLSHDQQCLEDDHQQLSLASNLHPRLFADLYKKKRLSRSSQEERRRAILNEQKKKRQSVIESNRLKDESQSDDGQHKEKKQALYKISEKFSNQLMYSEWLEEVPSDFESNWIMVLCPVGKRCLVVASDGTTSAYSKAGKLIARHSSILPGGSRESKSDETILDCVYNDYLRTYFILDCLCWKSHPILDSESEFRFFWLKCKLDEMPGLKQWSTGNPYAFKDVPRTFPLSPQSIQEQFEQINEPKMDGVLFYHKETHYTPGITPLVSWLKLYMLPEILNIPVPKNIADSAPSDYLNAKQAINLDKSRVVSPGKQHLLAADHRNSADEDTMSDDTDAGFLAIS